MSTFVKIVSKRLIQTQVRKMSSDCVQQVLGKATIAVGQMRATNNKDANLCQVEELLSRAKSKEAKLLFLPECCDFVAENRNQTLEFAEALTGPTVTKYREWARSKEIWLSLGGVHELQIDERSGEKTGKIFNTHLLINDEGNLVGIYRKLHLFDAETKDFRLKESDTVSPGGSLIPPVHTPFGRIGLQICYDLRFPETGLLLRKMGAQLLTYPAAFTYSTGKAHWELLLRARAIENQCFVVAAAQQGSHNPKRKSWGHAMIIGPWGEVLADCGGDEELAVGIAEIDLSKIDQIKTNMPCFQHRRNDVYSLTAYNIPQAEEYCNDRLFANNTIDKRTIFFESEHCFAFTNLRCVVEGHVLVSTKRITKRLIGLNCAEMTDLFATVCFVQRMLENIYGTTSATVTVQDGSEAGQTVPHVHFHVMPRRGGDFGHNDQIYVKLEEQIENKPQRTLEERIKEAEKYRHHLKQQKPNC